MSQEETVDITITPDGQVHIDQKGFVGSSCADIAKALSKVLGKTVKQERKVEYYKRPVETRVRQRREL